LKDFVLIAFAYANTRIADLKFDAVLNLFGANSNLTLGRIFKGVSNKIL
jgi:hypothetical protein